MIDTAAHAELRAFDFMFAQAFAHVAGRLGIGARSAQDRQVAEAGPQGGGHGAPVDVFQLSCALQSGDDVLTQ